MVIDLVLGLFGSSSKYSKGWKVVFKINKLFIVVSFVLLLSVIGCFSEKAPYYPVYKNSRAKYLFTRNQKIIFLGFFGKNRKKYIGQEDINILESWLLKRPLYRDLSYIDLNRNTKPSFEEIRKISEQYKAKRVLLFYVAPSIGVFFYIFGKEKKHNRVFNLLTTPRLPNGDDMKLTLSALDIGIQPASPIVSETLLSSTVILSRNSALDVVRTYIVLTNIYMENPTILTFAKIVHKQTSTVVNVQDWEKKFVLKKGYWIFPFIYSEKINALKKKYKKHFKNHSSWNWFDAFYSVSKGLIREDY